MMLCEAVQYTKCTLFVRVRVLLKCIIHILVYLASRAGYH